MTFQTGKITGSVIVVCTRGSNNSPNTSPSAFSSSFGAHLDLPNLLQRLFELVTFRVSHDLLGTHEIGSVRKHLRIVSSLLTRNALDQVIRHRHIQERTDHLAQQCPRLQTVPFPCSCAFNLPTSLPASLWMQPSNKDATHSTNNSLDKRLVRSPSSDRTLALTKRIIDCAHPST